jgi:hypothetical protein
MVDPVKVRETLEEIDGFGFATQAEFEMAFFSGKQVLKAFAILDTLSAQEIDSTAYRNSADNPERAHFDKWVASHYEDRSRVTEGQWQAWLARAQLQPASTSDADRLDRPAT